MRNMNGRPMNGCANRGMQNQPPSACHHQSMPNNNRTCRPMSALCEPHSSRYNDPLQGMPIGIGYVPWQEWGNLYDPARGLCAGTMFAPLDLPFYGCIPNSYRTKGGAV